MAFFHSFLLVYQRVVQLIHTKVGSFCSAQWRMSLLHAIPENSFGWWLTYPSEKYEFVSWDDYIPSIWKVIKIYKNHVPNHQSVIV